MGNEMIHRNFKREIEVISLEKVQEMPSPKSKHSKSRRDKRRANWKLTVPGLVECPQCHAMKLPHHVCPVCGFYKGRSVIQAKTEE